MFRLVKLNEDANDNEYHDQLVADIVQAYNGRLTDEDSEKLLAALYNQANDLIAAKERVSGMVLGSSSNIFIADWEDALSSDAPAVRDDAEIVSPDKVSRPHYPEDDDAAEDYVDIETDLDREADILRQDAGVDMSDEIEDDISDAADELRRDSGMEPDGEEDLDNDPDYDEDPAEDDVDSNGDSESDDSDAGEGEPEGESEGDESEDLEHDPDYDDGDEREGEPDTEGKGSDKSSDSKKKSGKKSDEPEGNAEGTEKK